MSASFVRPVDFPQGLCNHNIFEARAALNPESVALIFGDISYTYSELNEEANRLAHYLMKRGVAANVLVGIFLERSPEMVIAALAILKAGGAYVPYDPSYPPARLAGMLQSVTQRYLLTVSRLRDRLPSGDGAPFIILDEDRELAACKDLDNPLNEVSPEDLAYVIFTSGSTGKAKATAVHHAGWRNLLNWFTAEFEIAARDKVLLVSSFSFDITQRALVMPLVAGGELHLLESNYFIPDDVLRTVETGEITLMSCAPSPFYTLFENRTEEDVAKLRTLRSVFLGGEAIAPSRLKRWWESDTCTAELVNVYGVAECSDVSTFYRLKSSDSDSAGVPIGKPIFNTSVYIMDDQYELVSEGGTGEICIAGAGVGKGYLNDSQLTAQKFVHQRDGTVRGLLYRTGDLGRVGADGNFEYAGRIDHQVKLRGNRIELGEIEATLRQHPGVKEAVVVVTEGRDNDQVLVAHVVPSESVVDVQWPAAVEGFRSHLRGRLPQTMVPNKFVKLMEVPLSPNGKIDRRALEASEQAAAGPVAEDRKWTTTEIVIGAFVAEALRVEKVGLDDDFFDLGGHSIMAMQVVTRINETFRTRFDLRVFSGDRATVASLSNHVNEEVKRSEPATSAA